VSICKGGGVRPIALRPETKGTKTRQERILTSAGNTKQLSISGEKGHDVNKSRKTGGLLPRGKIVYQKKKNTKREI